MTSDGTSSPQVHALLLPSHKTPYHSGNGPAHRRGDKQLDTDRIGNRVSQLGLLRRT
jgi:hypothetical protein